MKEDLGIAPRDGLMMRSDDEIENKTGPAILEFSDARSFRVALYLISLPIGDAVCEIL